jgi:HTH-type transcriptional regulator/antitoxin HigA
MKTTYTYEAPIEFHPGEILEEKLEELGMAKNEFAIRTGKPEKTIIAVLKGDSSITPDMAVKFESVTNIPVHFWLKIQRNYDEYVAREKRKADIAEAVQWSKHFPVNELIHKGCLPELNSAEEKADALLRFFGLADHRAWENFYLNQQLKVTFRISLSKIKAPYSVSAWLRMGERQALEKKSRGYSAADFRKSLEKIRRLSGTSPEDSVGKVQQLCQQAGVRFITTPSLNKAPISGASRWFMDAPLIQLVEKFSRKEIFWFTFFHEAGHILLHGKREIFLENIDYPDLDKQKEDEADAFAREWLGKQ